MKRLLFSLLAALALPTAVNANVDPKVAEMCMKAVDFQGCVNAMTGKKANEFGEGTRDFLRNNGSLSLFNPLAISAMEVRGEYGRYLKYRYVLISNGRPYLWKVEADCQDYTADWKGDDEGWRDLNTATKESSIEAKNILDEFCPQMDRLVKEANSGTKEYYRYPINSSSAGGYYKNPNSYNSQQNQKIRQLQMQQQTERYKKSLEQYGRYNNHPQYNYGY